MDAESPIQLMARRDALVAGLRQEHRDMSNFLMNEGKK